MSGAILVTGGTGKTGRRLVERLRARGIAPRVASRSIDPAIGTRFDWHDDTTHGPALDGVRTVYLVAPGDGTDVLGTMQPFLERAVSGGVERFVLLSASSIERGGPLMGAVHDWLATHAPAHTVLRPSWFMQNFSENQHLPGIRDAGVIRSATGDGQVGFVDVEDIAAVACEALVDPNFAHEELILTGPATLSYDDVARIVGNAAGKSVVHERLDVDALGEMFRGFGVPPDFAELLVGMDVAIASGAADIVTDDVRRVTGREPGSFEAFAQRSAATWRA